MRPTVVNITNAAVRNVTTECVEYPLDFLSACSILKINEDTIKHKFTGEGRSLCF